MLFFQMSAQVYYVPSQTEGRKKNLLEWKGIDLSSKLSLTCGGNVNYYKNVHHPITTCENREHFGNAQNKVSSPFNSVSRYFLFLVNLKRRRTPFLEGERWGSILWDYPQEQLVFIRDEKVFCEIWNNPISPFFIRPTFK